MADHSVIDEGLEALTLGKRILVIDDHPPLLEVVEAALTSVGAEVYCARNGPEGIRQLHSCRPHLIILDIMMPGMDGWQTFAALRRLTAAPVIFLTALGREQDVIRGLDCGATDYITKPFNMQVLLARVRSALRSAEAAAQPAQPIAYQDGHLTLKPTEHQVLVDGRPTKLTATEYTLLAWLIANANQVLTYEQILTHVWGPQYCDCTSYVHIYISRLRRRLEPDPHKPLYLLTERGVGYRFQPQPP